MIALLDNEEYFVSGDDNINDFLIAYADYIGLDMKIFKILANSNEMTTNELVSYINRYCNRNEEIIEIYEVGKKIY